MSKSLLLAVLCAATLTPVIVDASTNTNSFNPAISLILNGQYAHYSTNPESERLAPFLLNSDAGLRSQGITLGESEMTLSANIDSHFFAQTTLAFEGDPNASGASVEEAFVQSLDLSDGVTLKMGRFFSALGYLNEQHAHRWDFSDAPLIYQALFGNQLQVDGLQLSALLPTDRFMQLGVEALSGTHFPSAGVHQGAGAWTLFYTVGDDWDISQSWQIGLNYWRSQEVTDRLASGLLSELSFSGTSEISSVDFVYKWAPNGNPINQNVKLQFEYFERRESGQLTSDLSSSSYHGTQRGGYIEGIYQFMPQWSIGLRYDHLSQNNQGSDDLFLKREGIIDDINTPHSYSLVSSWQASEFSRIRLQYSRDDSRSEPDNRLFLDYSVSLGSHSAHAY
ncbi:MAG: hypothetical protein Q9O24_13655 [Gammaproteobacteria bacterium]|nr:hypothetical protein [Gammaproteobacteria bacterium]